MVSCQDVGRHIFNIRGRALVRLGPATTELHCQASGRSVCKWVYDNT
jgi:hypothetical protein